MDINEFAFLTRKIIFACREANLNSLKKLITKENVNWVFDDAHNLVGTPLFLLKMLRNDDKIIPCLNFLISMGADANWCNYSMETVLFDTDIPEILRLLVKAGANINHKNYMGLNVLENIFNYVDMDPKDFKSDNEELVKCLLDLGAIISNKNKCPDWILSLDKSRQECKMKILTLLGIKRFRHSPIIGHNGRDVINLIGKEMWSIRFNLYLQAV